MKNIFSLLAIIASAFYAQAQQTELSDNLSTALKDSKEKIEEASKNRIVQYSKNNKTEKTEDVKQTDKRVPDFFDDYINSNENMLYRNNNNDPVITNMPAPGPNLNYYSVDRNSNGNYDKVVN